MNNKRRRRKTVLDLNTAESSNSDVACSKAKCQKMNGAFGNSLTHLLEQYNSDSDDDTYRMDKTGCLNEQVNDFLKEIQCIGSENEESYDKNNSKHLKNDSCQPSLSQENVSSSLWQECFDESTGYPYYWHTETNQVTWELPPELKLNCSNNAKLEKQMSSKDLPRNIFPSTNPCKYPDHKLVNTIPDGMIPKDIVARNRFKQIKTESQILKGKKKLVLDKRKKNETKDEDSDDGRIEMITSFGSDNTDSDHSDDGRISPISQKNIISKLHLDESQHSMSNGDNCDNKNDGSDVDDDNDNHDNIDEKMDNSNSNDKTQLKNNTDEDKELAFSLVPGYADESDNEENSAIKQKNTAPLFPITTFENSRINERHSTIDSNIEESACIETAQDSSETLNADDIKITNKIDEIPKTNRFLENLGTSTKAFQRKKRIAFDVLMKNCKKSEMENSSGLQSEVTRDLGTMLSIQRGNEFRHGLGFSKSGSPDDNEPGSNSPEETTLHTVASLDAKKDISFGKSIGFVKGETLTLTKKNIEEPTKCTMSEDTQTIIEKLKFLSEGSQSATAVQIMNIQLQTLLNAWESGDLKDRYFFNWLTGTNRELCRLEKAAAPPGWDCQWDRSHKRYYYRNENNGETRWSYPDIIGGAEEMELCTTPPPPDLEEKINDTETDSVASNKNIEHNPQMHIHDDQYISNHQSNLNSNGDSDKNEHLCNQDKENSSRVMCQREDNKVDKIVESRVTSPSPPPPPRISGDDLSRDSKKRRDAERKQISGGKIPKEEGKIDKMNEIVQSDDTEVKTIAAVEVIPINCESVMTTHHSHLLASNPSHAEPLPPGVDQPEMPYAITAASIEPSVIFSAASPQTNASIYAATMQDPTNISIIGHHHPALVQNQLVHYPAYHPHLQNQAIIAAANRLAGPDTVQFMLDYTRIYGNTQVIAKPPVKMNKEPLGTALDSFYNDIASLENQSIVDDTQQIKHGEAVTSAPIKLQDSPTTVFIPPDQSQISNTTTDSTSKDKKKKKVKIVISKKQKQVSSMVAKWKKAQNYEGIN